MSPRNELASRLLRLAIALSIGLAEPYLEIAWKCRTGFASTEACVWGKSYLPLTRWLVLLLLTPVVYAVLSCARLLWLSRRSPSGE